MKKILKLIYVAITIFALSIIFCLSANCYYEEEDNNSLADANNVSVNETIYGNTSSQYDVDYYSFYLPSPGYIYVTANFDKYDDTAYIDFLDEYGDEIERVGYKMLRQSVTTLKLGLDSGNYYVKYNAAQTDMNCDYTMTINYKENSSWEIEPNSELSEGKDIYPNQTYYGSFKDCYDTDCYCLNVPTSGYYCADISTIKTDEHITVKWYDCDGDQIDKDYFDCLTSHRTDEVYLKSGCNYFKITISNCGDLCDDDYNFRITETTKATQADEVSQNKNSQKNNDTITKSQGVTKKQTKNGSVTKSTTTKSATVKENIVTEKNQKNSSQTIYVYNNYFKFTTNNIQVTIIAYIGNDSNVTIPSTIKQMPVVSIGDDVFLGTKARKVTVPDCVETFGTNAFEYDDNEFCQVVCNPNSAAEQKALDNNCDVIYISEDTSKSVNEDIGEEICETESTDVQRLSLSNSSVKKFAILAISIIILLSATVISLVVILKKKSC